jgi:hypothetical protein
MRKSLFLICVLGLPCVSWAQTNRASWANLSALQAGQKIQIVEMNSKKHSGTFANVSDTAILYRETAGEQTIQKQDVRSVKLMASHRLRNTIIGGAVGAGAGAGITAGTWENHGFTGGKGTGAIVGAVIGFVAGGVVGALLPSHKTIYSVNSDATASDHQPVTKPTTVPIVPTAE